MSYLFKGVIRAACYWLCSVLWLLIIFIAFSNVWKDKSALLWFNGFHLSLNNSRINSLWLDTQNWALTFFLLKNYSLNFLVYYCKSIMYDGKNCCFSFNCFRLTWLYIYIIEYLSLLKLSPAEQYTYLTDYNSIRNTNFTSTREIENNLQAPDQF